MYPFFWFWFLQLDNDILPYPIRVSMIQEVVTKKEHDFANMIISFFLLAKKTRCTMSLLL